MLCAQAEYESMAMAGLLQDDMLVPGTSHGLGTYGDILAMAMEIANETEPSAFSFAARVALFDGKGNGLEERAAILIHDATCSSVARMEQQSMQVCTGTGGDFKDMHTKRRCWADIEDGDSHNVNDDDIDDDDIKAGQSEEQSKGSDSNSLKDGGQGGASDQFAPPPCG